MADTIRTTRDISLAQCPKRVRAVFNGETVIDTVNALYLFEGHYPPVWYIPYRDVDSSLLTKSDLKTHCPFKGDATYWSLEVDGKTAENVAWAYPNPLNNVSGIRNHMAFYWDFMDSWLEEDEEVYVHPRDPRVRIDALVSSRTVRVEYRGEVLAESNEALFLFETGKPVRYYIPRHDVLLPLQASNSITKCPYKGVAQYMNIVTAAGTVPDALWYYETPLREANEIAGYDCFFNEKFDIFVDGKKQ